MSILGTLNRAYHNTKQSIPQDHGWAYDPFGKIISTTYQSTARITSITKFSVGSGDIVSVTIEDKLFPEQSPAVGDTIFVAGIAGYNGEFTLVSVSTSSKTFGYVDGVNAANNTGGDVTVTGDGWMYFAPTSLGEILMDPARVMSHPSFRQREGEGIYTYPFPPDITLNFIYHPATKVDGTMQRTLSSNVFITSPQLDEDVVISEIWLGGNRELSTLSEMFRVFHQYWTTIPDAGKVLGWEPRERTSDRFGIQIARVTLGGLDYNYREVRDVATQAAGSYLAQQLTVQFKLARKVRPPTPQITMVGR